MLVCRYFPSQGVKSGRGHDTNGDTEIAELVLLVIAETFYSPEGWPGIVHAQGS